MDLTRLKQKALLIPTPGQTEQEYLAGYLMNKGLFLTMNQEEFSFPTAIEKMKSWQPAFSNMETYMDEQIIIGWMKNLPALILR